VRFVVEKVVLRQDFLRNLLFPCQYHFTNATYSSSSSNCSYKKDNRAKPANRQLKEGSSGNVGLWNKDILTFRSSVC
jgi:hypothetical protein